MKEIKPKCKYFGKCGGCSLQHIPYEVQLQNKANSIKKELKLDNIEIFSSNPYNYRTRMDFIFFRNYIGFRKKKSRQIIEIDNCPIANNKINSLLKEVQTEFKNIDSYISHKGTGTYKYVIIRAPSKTSSLSFVLNPSSTNLNEAIEKIKNFSKKSKADNILITYTKDNKPTSEDYFVVKGTDNISEELLNYNFEYSIQGFFQNNIEVATKMHSYIGKILKHTKDTLKSELYDLYGGVGTFGIINSNLFKKVTIIESFPGSIASAKKNIQKNGITNTEAHVLDAKHLKKQKLNSGQILITDPPRSGMDIKTINEINNLKPKKLIYISCNPTQLIKELKKFNKYNIITAAIFDMFPQTNHMEIVLELKFERLNNK